MRGYSFFAALETEMFRCGRLYADAIHRKRQRFCDVLSHLNDKGCQFGPLRHQGQIHIHNPKMI